MSVVRSKSLNTIAFSVFYAVASLVQTLIEMLYRALCIKLILAAHAIKVWIFVSNLLPWLVQVSWPLQKWLFTCVLLQILILLINFLNLVRCLLLMFLVLLLNEQRLFRMLLWLLLLIISHDWLLFLQKVTLARVKNSHSKHTF